MESPQPPPFPPPSRCARFRLKQYHFDLDAVVGWSEFRVLRKLGMPDEKRVGAEWRDNPTAKDVIVRDSSGRVMRAYCFGPVPRTISALQSYQTWLYHNVRGMTWRLYLMRRSRIPIPNWFLPRVVVEVYTHPANAVF